MKEKLVAAIADMNEQEALSLVGEMLERGEDPQSILDAGSEAMSLIGERYDSGEYFLPELILAGDMMKQIGELVKPKLAGEGDKQEPLGPFPIIGPEPDESPGIIDPMAAFRALWADKLPPR